MSWRGVTSERSRRKARSEAAKEKEQAINARRRGVGHHDIWHLAHEPNNNVHLYDVKP